MKKTLFVVCFLASAILFLFLPPAEAALQTVNYYGEFFNQVGFTVPSVDFSGATITGSFTFADDALDTNALGTVGSYPGAVESISGTVTYGLGGSLSFLYGAGDADITIWDNYFTGVVYEERYRVLASGIAADAIYDTDLLNYLMNGFEFNMRSWSNTSPIPFITSDDISPIPSLFDTPRIELSFRGTAAGAPATANLIRFDVKTLSAVPEPSTLLLLGSGLLGLIGYGRKRMKK